MMQFTLICKAGALTAMQHSAMRQAIPAMHVGTQLLLLIQAFGSQKCLCKFSRLLSGMDPLHMASCPPDTAASVSMLGAAPCRGDRPWHFPEAIFAVAYFFAGYALCSLFCFFFCVVRLKLVDRDLACFAVSKPVSGCLSSFCDDLEQSVF